MDNGEWIMENGEWRMENRIKFKKQGIRFGCPAFLNLWKKKD
jgi:hypothetical protein